jgi:two-component system, OmpR family, response regulator RegX3
VGAGHGHMARVVVVEERVRPRAADLLVREGIEVEGCKADPDLVLAAVQGFAPDAVLLEVVTITRGALRLCSSIPAVTAAPVAVFCERAPERDVLDAYAAGAHTVMCEPVGAHEFVARVRAVLRRAPARQEAAPDLLVVGAVVLDRGRRQVTVRGEVVPMPRKEFDIAELLMCRAGSVVTRVQLVRELWGTARDTKTLDVQVGRLRARLLAAEGCQRIITVRGLGYRFATDLDLAVADDEIAIVGVARADA